MAAALRSWYALFRLDCRSPRVSAVPTGEGSAAMALAMALSRSGSVSETAGAAVGAAAGVAAVARWQSGGAQNAEQAGVVGEDADAAGQGGGGDEDSEEEEVVRLDE